MKKNIIFPIVILILGVTTYYIFSILMNEEVSSIQETNIDLPDSWISEEWVDNFTSEK